MTMAMPKYVTIMLVPEGTAPRSGWRMRQWQLRAIVIGIVVLAISVSVLVFRMRRIKGVAGEESQEARA